MFLVSFFLRFLMDLRASVPSKTFKMVHRGSIFHVFASATSRKIPTCFCHRFCIDFSSISAPKSLPNSIKKTIKKNMFFSTDFLLFLSRFGTHLGAKLAYLGAILAFLASLGAPLGDLGRHLGSKMLPRHPPGDAVYSSPVW